MVTSNRKFAISTGLSKNFCKMGEVVLVQQNYQDYNIYDRRENLIEKTRLIRDKYLIVSDVTLLKEETEIQGKVLKKHKTRRIKTTIGKDICIPNGTLNNMYQIKFLSPLMLFVYANISEEEYYDLVVDVYKKIKEAILDKQYEKAEYILMANEYKFKNIIAKINLKQKG